MIEDVNQVMENNKQLDDCMDDNEDDIEIIGDEDIEALDGDSDDEVDGEEVTEQVVDHSIQTFNGHKKAVLCCALSPDKSYAVSGGEDDKAYVWRTDGSNVVFEANGHNESVVCVDFNSNGSHVATGDMNGLIQVWTLNGDKVFDFDVDEINWMSWHPMANNVLLAGTSAGDAWMWKLNSSLTSECKTFQSFGKSNCVAKCMADGKRIAMGYEDGVIRIWDLKTVSLIHSINDFNAHKASVTALDCMSDNVLIGSGSLDSTAKLINSQTGKVVATFQCSTGGTDDNEEEGNDSVESVGLNAALSVLATGTVDGSVDIWDIPTQIKRHSCKHSSGISKLCWDTNTPHVLYTAGLDGVLNIYDARSGDLMAAKSGHSHHILDFTISKDSTIALTASEDNSCKIFSLT